MDIHKPHAPHSLGEFAREIATIVTGILIALALEQGIAWLHERNVAAEARASIRAEIVHNLQAYRSMQVAEPCIRHRLAQVGELLADPAVRLDPKHSPLWIGSTSTIDMDRARFQAASAAGRIALLTPDDQQRISEFYANFDEFEQYERQLFAAFADLRGLEGIQGAIAPPDRARLSGSLQQARAAAYILHIDARIELEVAQAWQLGIPASVGVPGIMQSPCLPIHTRREVAEARLASEFGQPE